MAGPGKRVYETPGKRVYETPGFQVTAATNDENNLKSSIFEGYFRINQHGWTKFQVTATTMTPLRCYENNLKE